MVVATSRAHAQDALALIEVAYESLPAVLDLEQALDRTRLSLVSGGQQGGKRYLGRRTNGRHKGSAAERFDRQQPRRVNARAGLHEPIDLSKVDEVGFADLIPGSGHGAGGYVNVASFEVYGKPVKRH